MIRVVVIDDHPIVCDGLVRLIGSDPELEVVGSGGDAAKGITWPEVAAVRTDCRKRLRRSGTRSRRAWQPSTRPNTASSLSAIRFCSSFV